MATQILFQSSLAEVVRKLRNTTKSEAEVIEQCIAETRKEISSTVQSVKVTAVLKAVYFSMLGYSAAYGAFNIIEVMADKSFANKRIGYMAASLTFTPKTDVLPLLTALLKRDLTSGNFYEVGFALYCISSICTHDLARDLVADVVSLLSHPRNYVRKKAVLSLYRMFFEYPDALRPTYALLKEKLNDHSERCDNDPAVRGAVVCVLCELARRNPANFLGLAVPFFSMLSTVQSNWTLIKIIKVFGYFVPLEPRLGKKLVDPIANLIHTTGAKSVQYECILAVANGMSNVASLTKLAAEKMKIFVEDTDQNLRYLGLDAMSRMMRENSKLLSDQRDVIIATLDDMDVSVRRKALEILRGLVTKKNLVSTINNMMARCVRSPPDEDWSNRVISTIIEVAQTDDYALVQDFVWYTGILLDLSLVNLSTYQHGALLEREFVTVIMRVSAVRQFGVQAVSDLFTNMNLLSCDTTRSSQWKIIKAAAFLCGEYPYWLRNKCLTCEQLLSDRIALMPPEAQVACVTAVGKIAAYVHQPCPRHLSLTDGEEELTLPEDPVTEAELRAVIFPQRRGTGGEKRDETSDGNKAEERRRGLELFRRSIYPDVQERAHLVFYQVETSPELGRSLYAEELPLVAAGAQDAVVPDDSLGLDEPFCRDLPALLQLAESDADGDDVDDADDASGFLADSAAELQRRREEARRGAVETFYIKQTTLRREETPADGRPGTDDAASVQASVATSRVSRKNHKINRDLLRPSNYVAEVSAPQRGEKEEEEDEATRRFRNIDVTRALAANEKLPEAIPYAQLLPMGGVSSREREETEKAAAAAAAAAFEPIVLLKEKHLCVTVCMESCHVHRDGTRLMFDVEISNLASGSSVYEVLLCIQHDEHNFKEESVLLESCDPTDTGGRSKNGKCGGNDTCHQAESSNNNKTNGGAGVANGVLLAERIKGLMSVHKKVGVKFISQLPASFANPLTFSLSYTRSKKPVSSTLQLLLSYTYFAKIPKDMTPDEFQKTILQQHLATAPVVSGFVDVNLSRVSSALPLILQKLRLRTMDVFKDAASFYGVLHARKSTANDAHIAVLLREESFGGKGVTMAVKAHRVCLAELLLQEIASLMMQEAS